MNIPMLQMLLFSLSVLASEAPKSGETTPPSGLQWQHSSELLEDTGVTTTNDDRRGNWYSKRQLFFEARQEYEKLRELVKRVEHYIEPVSKKQESIIHFITQFVQEYSFKEGIIDELLTDLEKELQKYRKKDIQLNEQERAYLNEIEDKKKDIENLKKTIQSYNELIMGLDKAFITFREQLARANDYEHKGWENYDKIAEVLNDEIAEQLYLEIKGFITNAALIESYIKNDFMRYLDQSERLVNEQSGKIKAAVDSLQARGLELVHKVEKSLEQDEEQRIKREAEERARKQEEELKKQQESSWWYRIKTAPVDLWHWLTSLFTGMIDWTKSFFVSGSKKVEGTFEQERATNPLPATPITTSTEITHT